MNIKILFILCLLFPSFAFCENVVLKSGKEIKGRIIERTDNYIKIESEGSTIYYEHKYIQRIEEDRPAVSPSPKEATIKAPSGYLKEGLKAASEARFDDAERQFKEGLTVSPADYNLKEALRIIGQLKSGAIAKDYAIYLFKGSFYLIDGQFAEATKEFEAALKLNPDDYDLFYYLGVSNFSQEKYEDAVKYVSMIPEKERDSEMSYYLGASLYALRQYPQALTPLTKAIELNPEDAEAHVIIGTIYYFQGESYKAKDILSKARELFRKKGDYLRVSEIEEFLGQISLSLPQ